MKTIIVRLIILILIIDVFVFFFMKTENGSVKKKKIPENQIQKQHVSAMDVMASISRDPLVVDRIDFNEKLNGSIGDFTGYSSISENDWLHGFPHEKS